MWDVSTIGLGLVFLGFGIVVAALLVNRGQSKVRGAGVVMIGPIPIVFGSDSKWASIAIGLAIVLVLLSLLLYVV